MPPPHQDDEREPLAGPAAGAAGTALARPQQVIDVRGVSPPLPILRAHRALRNMEVGQVLKVLTDQPRALAEFQALVKHAPGYELLSQDEEAPGDHVLLLRRRR